ncbi:MAG: FAD-dependent oxidoreductase [Panacagrimonas sp.]
MRIKANAASASFDKPNDSKRRDVLKVLAGGSVAALAAPAVAASRSDASTKWAMQADVVIVGSGIAATSAAIASAKRGASVILLEKLPFRGGTTAKSAGVFWIPNNPILRAKGVVDERLDTLRYMVRLAQPSLFQPDHPTLGIAAADFELLGVFVDNASRVVEELMAGSALKIMPWLYAEGAIWPDYYGHIPENKVERGRSIVCDVNGHPERFFWAGGGGSGESLLWQLQQGFDKLPIKLLLDHQVKAVTQNASGEVNGVVVDSGESEPIRVRANKAVIFATGGFTHNVAMADSFLKGRIWGGCAAPGSTGDFIDIATGLGAKLGNMSNAWWAQVPVEVAVKTRSVPSNIWCPPGDSMIEVNRYGLRFGNEKIAYNERAQLHFIWDPVRLEYPNLLGFMIWDARTAEAYAGYDPVPAKNAKLAHVIEGASLAELAKNIESRLAGIGAHTGGLKLAWEFSANLDKSIARFNDGAKKGKDPEFHRGETPNERAWQFVGLKPAQNPHPNLTMHPISKAGPYYAVILGAGTLDTKGGPLVNAKGQVLNAEGAPIPGLYGAGNCVASPAGQAYWGGGGTIGPAMTFGYLGGESAAAEKPKSV